MFTAGVLTVSDKGSRGERVDESGRVIKEALASLGAGGIEYAVVPDERPAIAARLREWSDAGVALVLPFVAWAPARGGTSRMAASIATSSGLSAARLSLPGLFDNAFCCLRVRVACHVAAGKRFYRCRRPD